MSRNVRSSGMSASVHALPQLARKPSSVHAEQFAADARRAPERIGAAQLTDQGLDLGARLGASGTA
jgi:hypothetical protein